MKRALFVIAPVDFKDEEYFLPKKILEDNNIKVYTTSLKEKAESAAGETIEVSFLLNEATENYDAIIFVGGPGASIYFNNPKAQSLAKSYFQKGKIVAAICIAPSILANAGILKGRRVTSFPSEKTNLESKGAIYTGEKVAIDGDIITAMDPSAAEKFGRIIAEKLSK